MIKPKCSKCGKELKEFGALMFSPPNHYRSDIDIVDKYHICIICWEKIFKLLKEKT